ncbi:hypothetical protein Mapa_007526 [Marchantia paleacea]|nr:hypothetical protein Mapa_007526 [Marchantia paleacea]
MATLADSFLADLEDLSDNEAPFEVETEEGDDTADLDDVMDDVDTLNYDDLDSVAKLQKSQRFNDLTKVKTWSLSHELYKRVHL